VGSNICNILLILGIAAVMSNIHCNSGPIRRDSLAVIGASVLLAGLSFLGQLEFITGLIMIGLLIAYISYCYKKDEASVTAEEEQNEIKQSPNTLLDVGYIIAGLGLLVWGADLLVNSATSLAREAGVSEAVIGLTLVAVGTSLPELATAVIAAYRKHADVVIGNVLGSNLFNILGILGITAMITPIPFVGQIATFDVWVMLAVAVITFALILVRKSLERVTGLVFLGVYTGYIYYLYMGGL
jgi:cation:H+ antiporter